MLVLHNGRIYTNDRNRPTVKSIAIADGRIIKIGDEKLKDFSFGTRDVYYDLRERVVLPGLTDAHIHLKQYGFSLEKVDCETKNKRDCLNNLAEQLKNVEEGEWILGHGWNHNEWEDGFGDLEDLDRISPNHPVYLTAKSLHAAWVNSRALTLANIDKSAADPANGYFGRDSKGKLNGILFEGAMSLVEKVIPEPNMQQVKKAVYKAQKKLLSFGITGVHDFDRQKCFIALQDLQDNGKLTLRVLKSIPYENMDEAIDLGIKSGFGSEFLRVGPVKLFADGALGPRTAAMFDPYDDQPKNIGVLFLDRTQLIKIMRAALPNGLSLAVHAIGDRANHEVISAFETVKSFYSEVGARNGKQQREATNKMKRPKSRIEHVQLLRPGDIKRFGAIPVVASMQPIHAVSDIVAADQGWGERSRYGYAWAGLLQQGGVLAFGSDAPVESPNPFWGIWTAITRKRLDEYSDQKGWYPEQCISREEAIRAYTIGPAYAAGVESYLGKIKEGYYADLIVLEEDPFRCKEEKLREILPTQVMVNGKWVV